MEKYLSLSLSLYACQFRDFLLKWNESNVGAASSERKEIESLSKKNKRISRKYSRTAVNEGTVICQ